MTDSPDLYKDVAATLLGAVPPPSPPCLPNILKNSMANAKLHAVAELKRTTAELARALGDADLDEISVTFDGYSDEGSVEVHDDFDVPDAVAEAAEAWGYALLEQRRAGWEINEGAYGEATYTRSTGRITLDFNERFVDSIHHDDEWNAHDAAAYERTL